MIRIAVLTTTRAEYGLMRQLIFRFRDDNDYDLNLLVTGTHLSDRYGYTVKEIEEDNVPVAYKADILVENNGKIDISRTMSKAMYVFWEHFHQIDYDCLLVDGDRYETFAICVAAVNNHIPIIHCGGGETTGGAMDEYWRHCITKMSYLHFPTMELYRRRIISMGENPERVFCVGSLGLDNIRLMDMADKKDVETRLGIILDKPYALVTFHPVTMENDTAEIQIKELLKACEMCKDMKFVFTKANADKDSYIINELIQEYVDERPQKAILVSSLGAYYYLSAMKYCEFVLGNSSSGLIETPSFGIPTINIGDRQKGREKAASVIDCRPNANMIYEAMMLARNDEYREKCRQVINPNGDGHASERIISIIKQVFSNKQVNIEKTFYDGPELNG